MLDVLKDGINKFFGINPTLWNGALPIFATFSTVHKGRTDKLANFLSYNLLGNVWNATIFGCDFAKRKFLRGL